MNWIRTWKRLAESYKKHFRRNQRQNDFGGIKKWVSHFRHRIFHPKVCRQRWFPFVFLGLSILLGCFFIFMGFMKISPYISKELHRDLVSWGNGPRQIKLGAWIIDGEDALCHLGENSVPFASQTTGSGINSLQSAARPTNRYLELIDGWPPLDGHAHEYIQRPIIVHHSSSVLPIKTNASFRFSTRNQEKVKSSKNTHLLHENIRKIFTSLLNCMKNPERGGGGHVNKQCSTIFAHCLM